MTAPRFYDVMSAVNNLEGRIYPTSLVRHDIIDDMFGATIWFKPECNQKVGAFKYRGAYNRLCRLTESERRHGVVAFSSGNHAQGVARAAKELGISAKIVMPSDAPLIKVSGVKRDGAEIVFYDRMTESREAIAAKISRDENRVIVPSYDDPFIIAGQGTVGVEIISEAQTRDIQLDRIITPLGGGGLCAGINLSVADLAPDIDVYGAEPLHYNDHQLSLQVGRALTYADNPPPTLCDAIMTPKPGDITFAINKRYLRGVYTASDRACLMAMAILKAELGLTVEPGGVVALAGLMSGGPCNVYKGSDEYNIQGLCLCIVLSGGNVDQSVIDQSEQALSG